MLSRSPAPVNPTVANVLRPTQDSEAAKSNKQP